MVKLVTEPICFYLTFMEVNAKMMIKFTIDLHKDILFRIHIFVKGLIH